MLGRGEFHRLKGLLYFTDGEGIYPVKRPVYDTAFVFVEGAVYGHFRPGLGHEGNSGAWNSCWR